MEGHIEAQEPAVVPSGSAVFLDTTIQIGRFVHSPEMKQRIRQHIQTYDVSLTSLVVRQEFRRRLLKEADYLLRQLKRLGSYAKLRRHVDSVLTPWQGRKRNICVDILNTFFENDGDADLTERIKYFLRDLITGGLAEFDELVDRVIPDSGCACGRQGIREVKKYQKYDFCIANCSQAESACRILDFLAKRKPQLRAISCLLKSLPAEQKTDELKAAEEFIEMFFKDPLAIRTRDPCYTVGDLLVALESADIPVFYTMNAKESEHLCRALHQQLIVRPRNPDRPDIVHPPPAKGTVPTQTSTTSTKGASTDNKVGASP